jgi:hypothetical protein
MTGITGPKRAVRCAVAGIASVRQALVLTLVYLKFILCCFSAQNFCELELFWRTKTDYFVPNTPKLAFRWLVANVSHFCFKLSHGKFTSANFNPNDLTTS